jgi:hypothetical protein
MKACLLLVALATFAAAESVTLAPSQDGDVYSYLDAPTSSLYTLNVSASGEATEHSNRSLIQFDLSALGISANEIGSAALKLYTYPPDQGSVGFGDVSIHRQAIAWTAATLRWNQIQPLEQVAVIPVTAVYAWTETDVTSLVKQWVAGTTPNHGFVLKPQSETSGLSITFMSMDLPNAAYTPRLVITRAEVLPVLSISRSAGQFVLEWPAGSTGWTLQETENPAGTWTNSTATVTSVNGKWRVALSSNPTGRGFFRLSKP